MKAVFYFSVGVYVIALFSCKAKPATTNIDSLTNHLKPGKHCYIATFEKDTAHLTLNITDQGQIRGEMAVDYHKDDTIAAKREPTDGKINGTFRGDTLMADYYFTSGKTDPTKYINPVALLHKGDTLIMGYGRIYSYLGRTYFDPQTPITFTRSKFRFLPVECKK